MSVIRIASRYAKSLIDLSLDQNKLERVLEDIQGFQKATKQRDFSLLLKSPIVNPDKKKSIIKAIFEGKFDDLTMAFINIIINKGREAYLADIANEFVAQYKKIKHISTVRVTSAAPLSEETLEAIKKQLKSSSATEENIELETAVNPDLIGGFVIEFDDKLYDASVAHKLDQLKKEFSGNAFMKSY